jgi:ribosomal protein S14
MGIQQAQREILENVHFRHLLEFCYRQGLSRAVLRDAMLCRVHVVGKREVAGPLSTVQPGVSSLRAFVVFLSVCGKMWDCAIVDHDCVRQHP